jgi:hypothetical protein
MKLRWLLLGLAVFVPVASSIRASLPPEEQWLTMGTDSRGKSWSMLIVRGAPVGSRPASFVGDVTVDIPIEPRVEEPRIWTIDAKDRLWVFDEKGRGLRYDIRSRKLEHLTIPVRQQVSASLTVRGDTLWFQEFDPAVGGSISSWRPGDAAVKRAFVAPRPLHLEGYALSPSTLWVAATAHGTKHPILRAAVDPSSGKVLARFEASVSGSLEGGAAPRMVVDGDAWWITHPASGRIDRLERTGGQRHWSIGVYSPADLIISKGRAVVTGRRGAWQKVGPVGPSQSQWTTTSARVFLLDPKLPEAAASAEVDARFRDASLSVSADGTVKLGTARVRLEPPRPRIEGQ